jgi:hypothetical protein
VRIVSALLLTLCLAGCHRGDQNKEAVRQGIVDHLKSRNMAVDLELTSVQFNGNQATAEVSIWPKAAPGQKMSMGYKLEQRDGKWTVLGLSESVPHGGGAMPGGAPAVENPHGGAMPMPAGPGPAGGKMPAPENLPPAGSKK